MKKRAGLWILGCVLAAAGVAGTESAPSAAASPQAQAAVAAFMQGPSVFIENAGQWGAPEIRFALDGQGANVGLTDRGPKFQLFRELPRPAEAAAQVADAEALIPLMTAWLSDAALRARIGEQGRRVVARNRGALERLIALVEDSLAQGRKSGG